MSRNLSKRAPAARRAVSRLTIDQAFIALFISAMEANRHVSREEAARAHHIIWSMKRFRRKSGESVDRVIDAMRTLIEQQGAAAVMTEAARTVPARLRPAAFALSTDLVLADGTIERTERQFLNRLAGLLGLDRMTRDVILDAIVIKNSA
jgi:tellurite resistance protein